MGRETWHLGDTEIVLSSEEQRSNLVCADRRGCCVFCSFTRYTLHSDPRPTPHTPAETLGVCAVALCLLQCYCIASLGKVLSLRDARLRSA